MYRRVHRLISITRLQVDRARRCLFRSLTLTKLPFSLFLLFFNVCLKTPRVAVRILNDRTSSTLGILVILRRIFLQWQLFNLPESFSSSIFLFRYTYRKKIAVLSSMVRVSSSSSIHERPDHVQNMTNEVFEPCQTVWTRRWRNTLHRSRDAGNRLDKSYKIYRGRGRTTNKRTRATAGGTRTWKKRKNLSPGKTGHGTLGLLNSCVATTFLRSWTGRRWIVPEKNNAPQPQLRDGTRLRRSTLVSKRSNVTVQTHKRK